MKLEYLTPYFPFNLRNYNGTKKKEYIIGSHFENYKMLHLVTKPTDNKSDWVYSDVGIKYCKPILKPMRDLIKPNVINNKETTFMAELWEMKTQKGSYTFIGYEIINNTATMKFTSVMHPQESVTRSTFFDIDLEPEDITFSLMSRYGDGDDKFYLLGNEFKMYQKLFEWHFDVFGLIDKGLAIDINTIE